MVATFNIQIVKSTLALVALVAGPFVAPKLPKAIPRFLLLRLWVWLWLILALFWISQEAGRIDARKVFDKQARGVNIFFADAFKKDLAANENKHWAEQRIAEIRKASELGAVALIWRSSEESILLMFGTSGELKGVPIEILRINNSYIVSIFTKISSKPKR